jgi:hypothetical protein
MEARKKDHEVISIDLCDVFVRDDNPHNRKDVRDDSDHHIELHGADLPVLGQRSIAMRIY